MEIVKCNEIEGKKQMQSAFFFLLFCGLGHGLFYEWTCGLVGIVLAIFWIYGVRKRGSFSVPKAPLLLGMGSLPLLALVTAFFAIDKGMAVMGAVKFLPLLGWFLLMAMDEKGCWKKCILYGLPYVSGALTLLGMAAWFTPWREYFFIQNRFSGTFQYANSYALFLLVSLLLTLYGVEFYGKPMVAALAVVFASGILATGCRTVAVLAVFSALVWAIGQGRKVKPGKGLVKIAVGGLGIIGLGLLVIGVTGGFGQISRFTEISLTSSSLVARILYIKDGIGMLTTHPLGLGYRGFQFYQGAVQTGNYQATYAHNELLQSGLDFGIPMMIFLGAAYLLALYGERKNQRNFMVLLVCGIHSLVDWDFQFLLLPMVLTLFVSNDSRWEINLKHSLMRVCAVAVGIAICVGSIWLGTASFLEFVHDFDKAAKVYPGLTTSQMQRINLAQEDSARYQAAEQIAKQNDYCTIALQAMAERAASQGDFAGMAQFGKQAVISSRYNSQGYEIYLYLLSYAAQTCSEQGQSQQVYHYLEKAAAVAEMIEEVEQTTSPYAVYLHEKPEIRLGDQYETYMKEAAVLTGRKG